MAKTHYVNWIMDEKTWRTLRHAALLEDDLLGYVSRFVEKAALEKAQAIISKQRANNEE